MERLEEVKALRARTDRHYNCCQSVLIPFCPELGLTHEEAYALGAHFGGGMRMGSVCGALTGGLMVLGMLGFDQTASAALIRHFRDRSGYVDCADLLEAARQRGEEKKTNCDRLVLDMVTEIDALLHTKV